MTRASSMFQLISEQAEQRPYFETGGIGRSHEFYTGEEQHRREMARIYGRRWLPVDHVSRLKEKGSYTTLNIGTGSVLLLHGDNGIQAYHNYCRHRGYKLVEEAAGKRQSLVCLYHCWVYDRNGALKSYNGTYFDHFFEKEKNGLLPVRTEIRHGVVFVAFSDDAPDLDESSASSASSPASTNSPTWSVSRPRTTRSPPTGSSSHTTSTRACTSRPPTRTCTASPTSTTRAPMTSRATSSVPGSPSGAASTPSP